MLVVIEIELGELSVNPCGTSPHEPIFALEFWEDEVFYNSDSVCRKFSRMSNVHIEESECMHQGFFVSEIV